MKVKKLLTGLIIISSLVYVGCSDSVDEVDAEVTMPTTNATLSSQPELAEVAADAGSKIGDLLTSDETLASEETANTDAKVSSEAEALN